LNKLSQLKTVFSSKHSRREDRQEELETMLKEFYEILFDYCAENKIDCRDIITTKLTEPLFYELREKLKEN
jgi:hypothetical protein